MKETIPLNRKKLTLIAESSIGKSKKNSNHVHASINTKYGIIIFSVDAVKEMNMDKSFVKFYYDRLKKVVAWRVTKNLEQGGKTGHREWRYITVTKVGNARVSIKKLLQEIGSLAKDKNYNNLPVQKYKEYNTGYHEETYYFVSID